MKKKKKRKYGEILKKRRKKKEDELNPNHYKDFERLIEKASAVDKRDDSKDSQEG